MIMTLKEFAKMLDGREYLQSVVLVVSALAGGVSGGLLYMYILKS